MDKKLLSTMSKFPGLKFYNLRKQQTCQKDMVSEIISKDSVIRIIGLDRPLDIFWAPHNLKIDNFDSVWERSEITLNNIKVADEIDLLLTKEGTGRSVDIADIAFLESKIRKKMTAIMPSSSFEAASEILSRYYDYEVCRSALNNPDKRVVDLALQLLKQSADDGDPFAEEILEAFKGG